MYFNRLDIMAAHWLFLSQYHEGQGSERYRKLSWILSHMTPSPLWRCAYNLPENAREIYRQLVVNEHGLHSTCAA